MGSFSLISPDKTARNNISFMLFENFQSRGIKTSVVALTCLVLSCNHFELNIGSIVADQVEWSRYVGRIGKY